MWRSFLANTPVLATKVGGITEFLNDKNSILIKPNNQKELKLSLIKFVKNPMKYKKKSMAGKKIIYKNLIQKKWPKILNFFSMNVKKNYKKIFMIILFVNAVLKYEYIIDEKCLKIILKIKQLSLPGIPASKDLG